MTPQYLRMQAFGSYLHRTEIDFTKLGTHPLFLITGATGGGKTTILDAICCALYCQSTGGRRSWTAMRSLAAGPEDETVVDFRFAYEGKEYRFFRSLRCTSSEAARRNCAAPTNAGAVRRVRRGSCFALGRKRASAKWRSACWA